MSLEYTCDTRKHKNLKLLDVLSTCIKMQTEFKNSIIAREFIKVDYN